MLNKSEKKYLFIKILSVLVVLFFIVMAFIQPKPTIEQVEKPYVVTENAQ